MRAHSLKPELLEKEDHGYSPVNGLRINKKENPIIETRIVRKEERDKRLDHRSARNTFTNLVAGGTKRIQHLIIPAQLPEDYDP